MDEISLRELHKISKGEITARIPFWITADGERIALVIHPQRSELFTRIDNLIKKEARHGNKNH